MLSHLRVLDPNIERILDIGFSPPKDYESMTLEDEKNLYLDVTSQHFQNFENLEGSKTLCCLSFKTQKSCMASISFIGLLHFKIFVLGF